MLEKSLYDPVVRWLSARGYLCCGESRVSYGPCDVVGARFEARQGQRKPRLLDVIAVELKVDDVAGVLRQAEVNREQAWSYAALPAARIARMRPATVDRFSASGSGLLSVDGETVVEVCAPNEPLNRNHPRLDARLWRRLRRQYLDRCQ